MGVCAWLRVCVLACVCMRSFERACVGTQSRASMSATLRECLRACMFAWLRTCIRAIVCVCPPAYVHGLFHQRNAGSVTVFAHYQSLRIWLAISGEQDNDWVFA